MFVIYGFVIIWGIEWTKKKWPDEIDWVRVWRYPICWKNWREWINIKNKFDCSLGSLMKKYLLTILYF